MKMSNRTMLRRMISIKNNWINTNINDSDLKTDELMSLLSSTDKVTPMKPQKEDCNDSINISSEIVDNTQSSPENLIEID